jgi:hypothetical protein
MADLNININIRISRRAARWAMTALCLCLMVMVVSPEDITLDTYYPAPTGIYTNMITTQKTILARDGGNVGIGTANPTSNLETTSSANTGMTMQSLSGTGQNSIEFDLGSGWAAIMQDVPAYFQIQTRANFPAPGDNSSIQLNPGQIQTLVVTPDKVGIGVANPKASLDVDGGILMDNHMAGVEGGACPTEGMITYDYSNHVPIYCNNARKWASATGAAGGAYFLQRGCTDPNPNTGACTCPSGQTAQQVLGFWNDGTLCSRFSGCNGGYLYVCH